MRWMEKNRIHYRFRECQPISENIAFISLFLAWKKMNLRSTVQLNRHSSKANVVRSVESSFKLLSLIYKIRNFFRLLLFDKHLLSKEKEVYDTVHTFSLIWLLVFHLKLINTLELGKIRSLINFFAISQNVSNITYNPEHITFK